MLTNRDYEYYVICLVAFGCFLIVVSVFGCVAVCRNNVCLITMVRETETDQHKYKIDIRSEVRIHYVGYCIYSAAHRTFGQESGGEKLPGGWNRGGLATGRFKTINWGTYGYRTDESEWKITFFFHDNWLFQFSVQMLWSQRLQWLFFYRPQSFRKLLPQQRYESSILRNWLRDCSHQRDSTDS